MLPLLSDDQLLEAFQDLSDRKIIVYSSPQVVRAEDNGYLFEFLITTTIRAKNVVELFPGVNHMISAGDNSTPVKRFGPGSDIAFEDERLVIAQIADTHILVFNKFPVLLPQLLLLTKDSYQRQTTPLKLEDFAAVCSVLASLESRYYAIYNCCPEAGSSREHKHIQVLPKTIDFFPDKKDFDESTIPFRYFLSRFEKDSVHAEGGAQKLHEVYIELFAAVQKALGFQQDRRETHIPHNVVLDKEWMVLIPRRSNNFKGVTANSAGMMGSVWLPDAAALEGWRQAGMSNVFPNLGLPKA